jgi:hypothetical protein
MTGHVGDLWTASWLGKFNLLISEMIFSTDIFLEISISIILIVSILTVYDGLVIQSVLSTDIILINAICTCIVLTRFAMH